VYLSIYRTVCN